MLSDALLRGFAQFAPQVSTVGDLDGLWCTDRGAFGEERCSVMADDFDSWSLGQPGGQAGRVTVGQQIDGTTRFDVHEHCAVSPALAGRILIDLDRLSCREVAFDAPVRRGAFCYALVQEQDYVSTRAATRRGGGCAGQQGGWAWGRCGD